MFKKLENEAKISFNIIVGSPLVIRSGETNVLDPSLPDDQVIKQMKNGEMQVIIPGSSLKGVLRSRAEQLFSSQGYKIDNPFDRNTKSNQAKGSGKECYDQSCPISKLFGSLSLKSRIQFTDAYPKQGSTIKTGLRHGVGINRITGGAQNRAKFDYEVVEEGTFEAQISVLNYELWQLALILWLLKDLNEGYIKLGSSTSRGFGKVHVENLHVKVRTFTNLSDNVQPLRGAYESTDMTTSLVEWNKELFGWTFEDCSFERWIGNDGLLSAVSWPALKRVGN